jgi:hypothetical protein
VCIDLGLFEKILLFNDMILSCSFGLTGRSTAAIWRMIFAGDHNYYYLVYE